jgi:hypothetical protein
MTVSTSTSRIQYVTNGVSTAFPITFPFFDQTDINAVWVDSLGVSTGLALTTDFTLTGGAGSTGTLTTTGTLSPLAAGTLTIYRLVPYVQSTDFTENGPLPAEDLETVADKGVMMSQQLLDAASRSLSFPPTIDPGVSAVLPSPVADTYLGWNATADELENKTLPTGTAVYSSIANTRAGTSTAEAVTPDSLASLWQEGAAIVSAATIAKPSDVNLGGYYTQSGNTTTNSYWAGVKGGEEMEIRYSGIPQLSIAGNLLPPNGAAFTVTAGTIIRWRWDAALSKWRAVGGMKGDGTALIASGQVMGYLSKAVDYTAVAADIGIIEFTVTHTLSLPTAVGNAGLWYTVVSASLAVTVTIDPNGAETLDTFATRAVTNCRVTIVSDGANWKTIQGLYWYEVTGQTMTFGADLTLAHGLGKQPDGISVYAVCISTEGNYAVNDEFLYLDSGNNSPSQGIETRANATNLVLNQSSGIGGRDKTAHTFFNMTAAKWNWHVKAWVR